MTKDQHTALRSLRRTANRLAQEHPDARACHYGVNALWSLAMRGDLNRNEAAAILTLVEFATYEVSEAFSPRRLHS